MIENLSAELEPIVFVCAHFNYLMCDEHVEEYHSFIKEQLNSPRFHLSICNNIPMLSIKPHIYFYFDNSWSYLDAAYEASRLRSLFSTEYELDFIYKEEIFYVK